MVRALSLCTKLVAYIQERVKVLCNTYCTWRKVVYRFWSQEYLLFAAQAHQVACSTSHVLMETCERKRENSLRLRTIHRQ